jgi:hypothetical protein
VRFWIGRVEEGRDHIVRGWNAENLARRSLSPDSLVSSGSVIVDV